MNERVGTALRTFVGPTIKLLLVVVADTDTDINVEAVYDISDITK